MKNMKWYVVAMYMFIAFSGFSQDLSKDHVPSLVINSFNERFSGTYSTEWKKEGDLYYVEFEKGFFNEHEAWFDPKGSLVKYKTEISSDELPHAVKDAISMEFTQFKIDDVEKMEEDNAATYLLDLESNGQDYDLAVNESGEILQKKAD